MRRTRPSPEHAEAVSRRLATLSAELASVRGDPVPPPVDPVPDDPVPDDPLAPTHTRIRSWAPSDVEESVTDVPVPGRHASRRAVSLRESRAGDRWAGRPRLAPVHLAAVAVLAAVAMAVVTWVVVSSRPSLSEVAPRVDPPAAAAGGSPSATADEPVPAAGTPTGGTSPDAEVAAEVVVDVAGKVRRPGIAVLPAGSRVADALEAAGGARGGVDLAALNLARVLVDGEQVLVGVEPPAGVLGSVGTPDPTGPGISAAPGGLVDLNTADEALLDTLPGVGPVTAAAILAWRTEHGGFTSVDELLDVDGIGEATLADLAPLVTV